MDDALDALEFLLNAPALPAGCLCRYAMTDTLGLVQFDWNPVCPQHAGEPPSSTSDTVGASTPTHRKG